MIKRIIFGLILTIMVFGSILTPVYAADPITKDGKVIKVGDVIPLGKNAKTQYLGKSIDAKTMKEVQVWKATFDAPILNSKGTVINNSWLYDAKTGIYSLNNNLFDAIVNGSKVQIAYNGDSSSWSPVLSIGGVIATRDGGKILPLDPINSNYASNTIEWAYSINGKEVAKLHLRVIEGVISELWIIDKEPNGDVVITDNAIGKTGRVGSIYAIDADNRLIRIIKGNGFKYVELVDLKGVKYPITIDPTTTYYTSASDGTLYDQSNSYAASRDNVSAESLWDTLTLGYVGQSSDGAGWYGTYRSALYFDTSDIPDGNVITSATLSLYRDGNSFNYSGWFAVIQNGVVAGENHYPHDPLSVNDYNRTYYSGDGGTSGALAADQYNAITMTAAGRGYINKTGITKLFIRSDDDINNSAPAIINDIIAFYTYETGVGYIPKLEVTYTSVAPDISTITQSNVINTQARLNSEVIDDGGEAGQVSFGWDVHTHATIAAYANKYTISTGNYTTGDKPYYDISGLSEGTLYYFRVGMVNTAGSDVGSELTFTTLTTPVGGVQPPTYFKGIPTSNSISLTWITGTTANATMIRYNKGSTGVTSNTTGSLLYFGGLTYTTHTGLSAGDTYTYTAYGYSSNMTCSTGNVTIRLTTSKIGGEDENMPAVPTPTNLWLDTDYTRQHDNIFYGMINGVIDTWGVARNAAWLVLAVLIAIVLGLLVGRFNIMVGAIVMLVVMAVGWMQGLIPLVIVLASIGAVWAVGGIMNKGGS